MDYDVQIEMGLYQQFMMEIKERTTAIETIIDRIRPDRPQLPLAYVEVESCILQIRYCCELIALSALAAHRQLGLSKDLLKSWNPDRTFAALARLNPNCFPRAAVITRPNGGLHIELKTDQMNMVELQATYAKCGELLHRGVLKHALANNRRSYRADDVVQWTSRIRGLLKNHVVMLLEPGSVFLVRMVDENNQVEVLFAQAPGPSVLIG